MLLPRDHKPAETTGWVLAARIFSNVVSPPVIFAVLALVLVLVELPFWSAMLWAAIFGFWVSLAPSLLILYLLKAGRIGDLHMSHVRERRLPYLASVIGAGIALVLITSFEGPLLLRCLALFALIELSILGLVTTFWLISIHATSIVAATAITGLVIGIEASLSMLPLVGLVCWVRLYLRRHIVSQVVAGIALGVATVSLLALVGCFAGN